MSAGVQKASMVSGPSSYPLANLQASQSRQVKSVRVTRHLDHQSRLGVTPQPCAPRLYSVRQKFIDPIPPVSGKLSPL